MPTPPSLEYAFTLDVDLSPPQEFGITNAGQRRFVPITGGTFSGPKLSGTILPGGGDWNVFRPDGVVHVYAKYTIQVTDESTQQKTLISVTNEGYGRASPQTVEKIFGERAQVGGTSHGEKNDQESERRKGWYMRTWPRFEVAGDSPHAWLSKSCFVGDLLPPSAPNQIKIDVYEVM